MANRYWVGGNGAWDGTAGTKWALTSGGAGGQAVPTAADDVFFDSFSNGRTISFDAVTCRNLNFTGFSGTITGGGSINCYGDLTMVESVSWSQGGILNFLGTGTQVLTSAGKRFGPSSTPCSVSDTSTLSLNGNADFFCGIAINGGLITNNFNILASGTNSSCRITFPGTAIRTVDLGSSTLEVVGSSFSGSGFEFSSSNNLNLMSGTSTLIHRNAARATFDGGNKKFYNVIIGSESDLFISPVILFFNNNTFNNLTIRKPTIYPSNVILLGDQTITGRLSFSVSTIPSNRYFICIDDSSNFVYSFAPFQRNLIVNEFENLNDITFRAINVVYTYPFRTSDIVSGIRLGDSGYNSNINFSESKTVYWNLDGIQNWSSTAWANTSGGIPDANNYPLPQDIAVIDDNGSANTITIDRSGGLISPGFIASQNGQQICSIDASNRTLPVTMGYDGMFTAYGNWIMSNSVSFISGTPLNLGRGPYPFFEGTGNTVFINPNPVNNVPLTIRKIGNAKFSLGGNLNVSTTFSLLGGTFDANNYSVNCSSFSITQPTNIKSLNMGSGTWTLNGTGTVWNIDTTNLTFNANTCTIVLNDNSTTARTFAGGSLTYNNLVIGGNTSNSTTTFTGSNIFDTISSTKNVGHTITFTAGTTTTARVWNIKGTSGNLISIQSSSTTSNCTLAKSGFGYVDSNFLNVNRVIASPAVTWYVGSNSTNMGNNANMNFYASPLPILNFFQ